MPLNLSLYQQFAPNERVTRRTLRRWNLQEFVKPTSATWDALITHADLTKFIMGYFAVDMDQKWFFFTEGPDEKDTYIVHMVRSWSGCPMVTFRIQADLDEQREPRADCPARIVEITWETATHVWPLEDFLSSEAVAKDLTRQICAWVMDITLP